MEAKSVLDKLKIVGLAFAVIFTWVSIAAPSINAIMGFHYFPDGKAPAPDNLVRYLFFACVMAPLWEEFAFRTIPITFANRFAKDQLIPIVIFSSIIFGFNHGGSSIGILIQGALGLALSYVYIKTGYTYWCNVLLHALWNLACITLL